MIPLVGKWQPISGRGVGTNMPRLQHLPKVVRWLVAHSWLCELENEANLVWPNRVGVVNNFSNILAFAKFFSQLALTQLLSHYDWSNFYAYILLFGTRRTATST